MPGRFKISSYVPQFGVNNFDFTIVATQADLAFAAQQEAAFNQIQELISSIAFSQPNRTDAAQLALLRVSNNVLVSAATIASLGLTALGWAGAVDWSAGYNSCLSLLSSL